MRMPGFAGLAILAMASWFGSAALASESDDSASGCAGGCCASSWGHGCNPCCDDGCGCYCCSQYGYVAEAELLFLKYHRADGVNVVPGIFDETGIPADFDYDEAFRLTLGLIGQDGLGIRVRYFDYDDVGAPVVAAPGSFVAVDTYTIDVEIFESYEICCNWSLELSAGVRYNEFEEVRNLGVGVDELFALGNVQLVSDFAGWGGIIGAEVRRAIGTNGALYARIRQAILTDDQDRSVLADGFVVLHNELRDSVVSVTELSAGLELTRCLNNGALAFARAGFEWQRWEDYSGSFLNVLAGGVFEDQSAIGFIGYTASVGVRY